MKKTCGCLEVKCHVFYAKQLVIMQLISSHFAWRNLMDLFPCSIHINTVIKSRLRCMSPECRSIFVLGYQLDICLQSKSGVILYFFLKQSSKKGKDFKSRNFCAVQFVMFLCSFGHLLPVLCFMRFLLACLHTTTFIGCFYFYTC